MALSAAMSAQRGVTALLALLSLAASPSMAQQISATDLAEWATKATKATTGWDKSSTQGAKAALLEMKRTRNNNKLELKYTLQITGVPHDQLYTLVTWPIAKFVPETLKGVSISEDGFALCAGKTPPECKFEGDDPLISLTFPGVSKGEILRVGIVSADNRLRAFTSVVPDPILAMDRGCSLEAVQLFPKFLLALIRGKGFKPNEDVSYISNSAGEMIKQKVTANAQGEFFLSLLPGVKGKDQGEDELVVTGSTCAPKVSFTWGPVKQS